MAPNTVDPNQLQNLTRQQLKELEQKKLTPVQRFFELIIMILPLVCGIIAILEYTLIPDKGRNANPGVYLTCLIIAVLAYNVYGWYAAFKRMKGDKTPYEKLRYKAPLFAALYLLLAVYDYLTLKTGILTQPFVPCLNFIANAFWRERATILECTIHTLYLLFLGYFIGCILGLIGVFSGLASGAGVVISQYYGAGRHERVHDAIDTLYTGIVVGIVPLTILAVLLIHPLLGLMQVEESCYDESYTYMFVMALGLIGTIGYNANAGILQGLGDSKTSLLFLAVAAVMNIIGDL